MDADLLDDEPDLAVESWLVDTQALLHAALADAVAAGAEPPDEATLTYLARQYLQRVGDPVRLRVGNSALSGTDLAVRLVRLLIEDLTESEGEPPSQTVLAYPARWGQFRVAVLTGALESSGIARVGATPAPDAVAVGFAQRHGMAVGGRIAVLDVSATAYATAVVGRDDVDSFTVLRAEDGPGGMLGFHDALHAYVRSHLAHADGIGTLEDQRAFDAEVSRGVESAIATLSTDTEVSLQFGLPGQPPIDSIRVVRSEFEAVVRPRVVAMIDALHRTIVGAAASPSPVQASDLVAMLIVGSGAAVPLVAQQVGAAFSCPVMVDDEPATSVATGAAVSAWFDASAAAEQRDAAPDDEDEDVEPDEDRRRVPLLAWWSRQWQTRRSAVLVPGGVLAALVIFAALMASSMLSNADPAPAPARDGEPQVATTPSDSALTPTLQLTEVAPAPVPTPATGQAQPVSTTPTSTAGPATTPRRSPTAGPTTGPTPQEPADSPPPATTPAAPQPDPLEPPDDPAPATTTPTTPASTTPAPTTEVPTTAPAPTSTPPTSGTEFAAGRQGALR